VDEESDGESASSSTASSLEPAQFRMSLGAQKERAMAVKQRASINSNNSSLNNQQKLSITSQRNLTTATIKYGRNNNRSIIENNKNMQRVVLRRGGRNRVLDSGKFLEKFFEKKNLKYKKQEVCRKRLFLIFCKN